jgi:hypothetical protein
MMNPKIGLSKRVRRATNEISRGRQEPINGGSTMLWWLLAKRQAPSGIVSQPSTSSAAKTSIKERAPW